MFGHESAYFLSINWNKESVTLDFKHPRGAKLPTVATSDVVENFRPGTLDKLGLDYATLAAAHPRLIVCSISGFGQTGPRRPEAGYDAVMQAEGGLMSITGPADGQPYRLGVAIADIVTGMFAAQGVLLALLARQRTGRQSGRRDVGFRGGAADYQAGIHFATGTAPRRIGNRHPTIVPYETFAASDGDFVIAVGNDDQWRRFCRVAGLAEDERFATNRQRVTRYDELRPILTNVLGGSTRQAWIERLQAAGVPCGSVRDLKEVFDDPQLAAREMIARVEHATIGSLSLLGVPVKLSDTPGAVRTAPPTLGQHTDAVLRTSLGLTETEITALREQGAI